MNDTMIDRVEHMLAVADGQRVDNRSTARAVIAIMFNPTEAMVRNADLERDEPESHHVDDEDRVRIWQRMIEAALKSA